MPQSSRIGFVGLGNMGRPMTERLLEAGFTRPAPDAEPQRLHGLGARAILAASLAELGRNSDIVITMLPDGKIVREVLCGRKGRRDHVLGDHVLEGLAAGAL